MKKIQIPLVVLTSIALAVTLGCSRKSDDSSKVSSAESNANSGAHQNSSSSGEAQLPPIKFIGPSSVEVQEMKLDYQPFTLATEVAGVIIPSVAPVPPVAIEAHGPGKFELTMEQNGCTSDIQISEDAGNKDLHVLSDKKVRRIEFVLAQGERKGLSIRMAEEAPNNWSCNVAIRKI